MIDGSLTVDDMRLIVAIGKVFELNHGVALRLDDLCEKLKSEGFTVGHGMSREVDILESKLAGIQAKGKTLLARTKKGSRLTALAAVQLYLQCTSEEEAEEPAYLP